MALDKGPSEEELARALARFVTEPVGGYGLDLDRNNSPLQAAARAQIQQMTREIARDVVGASTSIKDVLEGHVKRAIEEALRDDAYLRKIVTDAVAKALVTRGSDDDADA